MKQYIRKIVISLSVLVAVMGFVVATPVFASPATDACTGIKAANPSAECSDAANATSSFGGIIKTIINVLSIVVGAASAVMLVIGGFRYVISGGDSNAVSGAKNTILYAIIGLVIVLFAQVIVAFVLDRATANPSAPPAATPVSPSPAPTPGKPTP